MIGLPRPKIPILLERYHGFRTQKSVIVFIDYYIIIYFYILLFLFISNVNVEIINL